MVYHNAASEKDGYAGFRNVSVKLSMPCREMANPLAKGFLMMLLGIIKENYGAIKKGYCTKTGYNCIIYTKGGYTEWVLYMILTKW